MVHFGKKFLIVGLSAALLVGAYGEAEAQRRGGRSRGGTQQRTRTGTFQRTNANGQSRNGTWMRQRQTEAGQGYRNRSTNTTVNNDKGTWNNSRNNSVERTGDNTYQRSWDSTTTGPNGQSRTWKGEGTGTVDRNGDTTTRTYQGTATSPKGNEYGVDKTTTRTKTDDGWEKNTTKTVTDSSGNVVGTGDRNSTGVKGEGVTTTGSWTNEKNGSTHNYSNHARWQYVDGQWVRTGENSRGGSSTVTVDENEE